MSSDSHHTGLPDAVRGSLWMCGTVACFTLMTVSARELSSDMDKFEILTFRSLIAVIVLAPFVFRRGISGLATPNLRLHVFRAVVQLGGQTSWIYGIALLPLAEVIALEFTIPLWTFLLALAFLGEKSSSHKVIATVFGFIGALVILRPGIEAVSLAALVVVFGASCFAGSGVIVKYLTRSDSPTTIVFYMNALQLPMVAIPAAFVWITPAWADVPWILIWGLSGLAAHYTMARGLALADITLLFPLDFLRLPVIALIGYLAYAEALDPWTAIGGIIIFASNYYSIRREARR